MLFIHYNAWVADMGCPLAALEMRLLLLALAGSLRFLDDIVTV